MAHFAKVNPENNIVEMVIVAEQGFIDTLPDKNDWIQTSYNTHGGIHYGPDNRPDGGEALRKNYAGVGDLYDSSRDAFIPPKPSETAILNEETCLWEEPVI